MFTVEVDRCERAPLRFPAECVNTARQIRDAVPAELGITVMLSGGKDSEVVARSFRRAGIPFRAAIQVYANDLNGYEARHAIRYCEAEKVPYRVYEGFDIDAFYRSDEALDWAETFQCVAPPVLPNLLLIDKLDGAVVCGMGDMQLSRRGEHPIGRRDPTKPNGFVLGRDSEHAFNGQEQLPVDGAHALEWDMWTTAGMTMPWNLAGRHWGRPVFTFFTYSPELILAYLNCKIIRRLVANELDVTRGSTAFLKNRAIKKQLFQLCFPKVVPRKASNGFAPLGRDWLLETRTHLTRRIPYCNALHRYPVRRLIRDLEPEGAS